MDHTEMTEILAELERVIAEAKAKFPVGFGSFHYAVERRMLHLADMVTTNSTRTQVRAAVIDMRAWTTEGSWESVHWLDNRMLDLADFLLTDEERAQLVALAERVGEGIARLTF
jgi:hypothetical protein